MMRKARIQQFPLVEVAPDQQSKAKELATISEMANVAAVLLEKYLLWELELKRKKMEYRVLMYATFVSVFALAVGLIYENNVMAGEDISAKMEHVSAEKWNILAMKNIFFGHQSVGFNILDGVKIVMEERPNIELKLVETDSPRDLDTKDKGILFHAKIGANFDPYAKIDDFARWMNNGVGGRVDIAFMKFCFVDIGTQTDLDALFRHYKKTMTDLKAKYPSTVIVHVTVPLLAEQTGLAKWKHNVKAVLKKIIGKNEYYENINKFIYNEMVRKEYNGKEPIFDLAAIESTFPDGSRLMSTDSGRNIESMVPAYTNDGGHLDSEGKRIVAENLLLFLANLDY